jgi:hypothetical protein
VVLVPVDAGRNDPLPEFRARIRGHNEVIADETRQAYPENGTLDASRDSEVRGLAAEQPDGVIDVLFTNTCSHSTRLSSDGRTYVEEATWANPLAWEAGVS